MRGEAGERGISWDGCIFGYHWEAERGLPLIVNWSMEDFLFRGYVLRLCLFFWKYTSTLGIGIVVMLSI